MQVRTSNTIKCVFSFYFKLCAVKTMTLELRHNVCCFVFCGFDVYVLCFMPDCSSLKQAGIKLSFFLVCANK